MASFCLTLCVCMIYLHGHINTSIETCIINCQKSKTKCTILNFVLRKYLLHCNVDIIILFALTDLVIDVQLFAFLRKNQKILLVSLKRFVETSQPIIAKQM